jgi:hypothetical protein
MAYEISWYQGKRVIYDRLYGDHDFQAAIDGSAEAARFLSQGEAPVHMIVDMRDLKTFPTNITKVHDMTQFMKSPSLGWVVVVGGSSLTMFLVNVMSQVVKFRVAIRFTLEEAVEFLQKQDPTLLTLPAADKQPASMS